MTKYPKLDHTVEGPCILCEREPKEYETYGPKPDQWDYIGICPRCWDFHISEPKELDIEKGTPQE